MSDGCSKMERMTVATIEADDRGTRAWALRVK
jgi:hypothetical protein